MDDKNELMRNCLDLVKTIVERTYFGGYGFNGDTDYMRFSYSRSELDSIIDYAFKKTIELSRRFDTEVPMQVYCEDLVVLSIDGKKPLKYYLTQYDKDDSEEVSLAKGYTSNFIMVDANEYPWYKLLGKYEGDTIKYSSDGDKNEHTIKILSTQRTENSEKLNEADLSCEDATEEERSK